MEMESAHVEVPTSNSLFGSQGDFAAGESSERAFLAIYVLSLCPALEWGVVSGSAGMMGDAS
jgi:hypothetical protein